MTETGGVFVKKHDKSSIIEVIYGDASQFLLLLAPCTGLHQTSLVRVPKAPKAPEETSPGQGGQAWQAVDGVEAERVAK